MLPEIKNISCLAGLTARFSFGTAVLMILLLSGIYACATGDQKRFATPAEATTAFVAALKSNDEQALLSMFGPDGEELIVSGDPVSDDQRREAFIRTYEEKNSLVPEGDTMVLVIGQMDWPFPIPLVKTGDQWMFDTAAGKEEILNRRIGENELDTVQTLLAVVDAQREYAMVDRDGDGIRSYAAEFGSDPGKMNGLYWLTQTGEPPSPLGELVAEARVEGYSRKGGESGPIPYHGYIFRMLTKQGPHADGGAYDYIVKNRMIGGFAVVAYPAVYGSTGVMTFLVNHRGMVYQKDLGENTDAIAKAMTSFDPDLNWKEVE
ncbi:MAG: DUF2950 domain-containing protein [Deltaproteobacteria bacterium]|nr:DUF2950 domain-containing protein [Deltaproteobacteria bacterium]